MLSYLQQEKGCKLDPEEEGASLGDSVGEGAAKPPPVCHSLRLKEDDLDVLARTRSALAPIHGLFTLLNALKNAWRLKCRNR